MKRKHVLLGLVFFILLQLTSLAKQKRKVSEETEIDSERIPVYVHPPIKEVTAKEKKSNCNKYKSSYIAYIDQLYFVTKDCKRTLLSQQEEEEFLRRGIEPYIIDGRVIQSLPLDKKDELKKDVNKLVTIYDNQCVTYSITVYKIEKGKKRPYPDWETFIAEKCELQQLTSAEIEQIPLGEEFESVVGRGLKLEVKGVVSDLIPEKKLCFYLPKKWYSFYDKLFIKKKKNNICYLQEFDIEKNREEFAQAKPIEIDQQVFRSVSIEWLASSK